MNRRSFVISIIGAMAAAVWKGSLHLVASERKLTGQALALPTKDQLAWQDLQMGMFVHFAPNTWQDKEGDDLSTPLSKINPEGLDTDQWARTAVDLGAKYIVFVAKHAGGFCMWQTETTDYGIRNTPWRGGRGDVFANVAASCRKHGLKLGVYVSPRDDHFGAKVGGICSTPALQARYDAMYRQQLTEIFTRYGPLVEVWFDGSAAAPVNDLLAKYQPQAQVFQGPAATIRWVGNEDGFSPYPLWDTESIADARSGVSTSLHSDPDGGAWIPIECDVSIRRPDWFWSTTNVRNLMTLDQLIEVYYRSVGHGAQLLLNIPPNRDGRISDEDSARAKEFGAEIRRRFDASAAETAGVGGTLGFDLPKSARLDHIILQEDCRFGQRVRAFHLEGRCEGHWVTLCRGSSIGQKRIVPVGPRICSALRLIVTETRGEPHIRRLAAFNTGQAPPVSWNAPAQIWAPNTVGNWNNFHFEVDLSSKITAAAQYRLRFVAEGGTVASIRNVKLLLNGADEPNLIHADSASKDALILTMPGISEKAILSGSVEGAEHGTILMQKL